MGRKRTHNKHLPKRMQKKGDAYYYAYYRKSKYVWESLGKDYGVALIKWAEIEGRKINHERTVEGAIAHYLETESHRLAKKTISEYKSAAQRLISIFGKMDLPDLKPSHVYEYIKRYGNVQVNRDKSLLSVVYSAARSWGWFNGDNPAKGIRRNTETPRKRYVTDSELSKLILCASPQLSCVIRLAYLTGLRQGDILKIRLSDLTEDGVFVCQGKTGKNHIIEWSHELRTVVAESRALRRRIGSMWLFAGMNGQPYTGDGFRAMWRRVKLKAQLPDVTFHDLRRKAGSDVDENHARELLDHSDARTTRRHYRAKTSRSKPVR